MGSVKTQKKKESSGGRKREKAAAKNAREEVECRKAAKRASERAMGRKRDRLMESGYCTLQHPPDFFSSLQEKKETQKRESSKTAQKSERGWTAGKDTQQQQRRSCGICVVRLEQTVKVRIYRAQL